jgi:hypothetical protein
MSSVICASALWWILRPAQARPQAPNRWLDLLAAGLGGITGGIVAFPSAALTVSIGLKGWPKERQRGVMQPMWTASMASYATSCSTPRCSTPWPRPGF